MALLSTRHKNKKWSCWVLDIRRNPVIDFTCKIKSKSKILRSAFNLSIVVHTLGCVKKKQKWSYHNSTPLRSVDQIYIAQKYLTFNHRLKIHPAQSNLNLQRILWKILNKMSKFQFFPISREKNSQISIFQLLSHFY